MADSGIKRGAFCGYPVSPASPRTSDVRGTTIHEMNCVTETRLAEQWATRHRAACDRKVTQALLHRSTNDRPQTSAAAVQHPSAMALRTGYGEIGRLSLRATRASAINDVKRLADQPNALYRPLVLSSLSRTSMPNHYGRSLHGVIDSTGLDARAK